MFQNAQSFNQDVDSWTPILVKKFENMFNGASRFNGKIFAGAGAALTMESMFQNAQSFNQDVDSLTPTLVTKFENMFNGASQFDGKIFKDTDAATKMESMFEGASSFTGKNAQNMATQECLSMKNTFKSATVFNAAITMDNNKWKVDKVTSFAYMFNGASSFNQDIRNWEIPTATVSDRLTNMFVGASNFQQNLCEWNGRITTAVTATDMFSSPNCPNPSGEFTTANLADNTNTATVCCTCATPNTDTATYPACA